MLFIKIFSGEILPDDLLPNGREIWSGGYGIGSDEDKLPAAVLTALIENFEVGKWYKLKDFQVLLGNISEPNSTATTVDVAQMGVNGQWLATIEISQESAAKLMCQAVLDHVAAISDDANLWVWVE